MQLNILHLSAVRNWGGGENHIENLCYELNKTESVQNIILCVKNSAFHKKLASSNVQFTTAPMAFKMDLRYVFKILLVNKKHKIDLIHIHDTTALTLAVMASKLGTLPPFVFSKKTSFPIKQRSSTLYKYNHPNIKKILCVSNLTKEITSESIIDPSKIVTIYHGTTINNRQETALNLKEQLGIPQDKIIIGTIANHIRAKNLKTWVMLVDYIINQKKDHRFHFVLIGKFTNRTANYLEEIKNKNLEKHVSITDFIPKASSLIPQFDISLLTSQSEGIPQFIYESFFYKIPVVSTNVGGIPEIIEDGINGMLTNAFEWQSLADKLIALSADKELRKKFTEKSYQKLMENYTTTVMAEQTLAEYKNVLYGKNGTGN